MEPLHMKPVNGVLYNVWDRMRDRVPDRVYECVREHVGLRVEDRVASRVWWHLCDCVMSRVRSL